MATSRLEAFDIFLPEYIAAGDIPKQKFNVGDLFLFRKWQGVAWIKWIYILLLVLNTIICFISFVTGLIIGYAGAVIFSILVIPLIWLVNTVSLRILLEVLLAILLLPSLLSKNYTSLPNFFGKDPAEMIHQHEFSTFYPPGNQIAHQSYRGEYPRSSERSLASIGNNPAEITHQSGTTTMFYPPASQGQMPPNREILTQLSEQSLSSVDIGPGAHQSGTTAFYPPGSQVRSQAQEETQNHSV